MRLPFAQVTLSRLVSGALGITVVCFALGSSSVHALRHVGSPVRWVALTILFALALAYARRNGRPRHFSVVPFALAAVFLGLAFVSAAWSMDPSLTIKRTFTLGLLFVTASALALGAAGRYDALASLAAGVVAGATVVAVAGALVYATDPSKALEGTGGNANRFRGLGENPNTVSMLAALALLLAIWLLFAARTRLARASYGFSAVALYLTVLFSGSRGADLALLAGLAVLTVGLPRTGRHRLLFGAASIIAFAIALLAWQPASTTSSAASTPAAVRTLAAVSAVAAKPVSKPEAAVFPRMLMPRSDEIGNPFWGQSGFEGRSLFGTSGRTAAWKGAIKEGNERPVLGFGFGTEERVFIDRYYVLEGAHAESSYIGLYLQLGLVGLSIFVLLALTVLWKAVRAGLAAGGGDRRAIAACGAVVAGGLSIAFVQSYVYSVGNVATVTLWLCAFLLAGVPAVGRGAAPPGPGLGSGTTAGVVS